jgi:uncharacterized protein YjbI with pentapeptide repeats
MRITNLRRLLALNQFTVTILIIFIIIAIIAIVYVSQSFAEKNAFKLDPSAMKSTPIEQYQIAKLAAEIREIRSDTAGSLFWLKLIALFVTVGGAVGGYLIGQSQITRRRLNFEHRKDIDKAYQEIIQELSSTESVLRAAAAVKLGAILQSFPIEWNVDEKRKKELIQLTKQVLAASLSIEENQKVLKTITISIALHKPWGNDATSQKKDYADLRGMDLSSANAPDGYWAKIDFTNADFYDANLSKTSFRKCVLKNAQFREALLIETVFCDTDCERTNFKLADLRRADFRGAKLKDAIFEGARVYGVTWPEAEIDTLPDAQVDVSKAGDGSSIESLKGYFRPGRQDNSVFGDASSPLV